MGTTPDVIIVGSGPAGAMAAWGLRGLGVRILDVGHTPGAAPRLHDNLYRIRTQRDLTPEFIGARFEGLRNLRGRPISAKLKAPGMDFVTRDWQTLTGLASESFQPVISLAYGGFGNAWGAGVYRFTARDLEGFPLRPEELAPHYDAVGQHIGISGIADDLEADFGHEPALDPPLRLSRNCAGLLRSYENRRAEMNRTGVRLGRSRLAVITRPREGREPYAYRALEFAQPGDPAVYNPSLTLNQLRQQRAVEYEPGWVVERFRETESGVEVEARRPTGGSAVFRAQRLILAAGALNSARIVLASAGDHETRLPLLDNPMTVLPVFHPGAFGNTLDPSDSCLAQLNLVLEAQGRTYQASLYGLNGAPVAEFLARLPFSLPGNLAVLKHLLPALSITMLFYPADPSPSQYLRLRPDGVLEAAYSWHPDPAITSEIARILRQLGGWTVAQLAQHPAPGNGIHYAGTLPMRSDPGRHQLHPDGQLHGTSRVYVADASAFPRLPAKNLTYTIMANALRITEGIRKGLG